MLDEPAVSPPDRLRLLLLYLLHRDGLLPADLQKLLAHAQLPPQEMSLIQNLALLGARTSRGLKDSRPQPLPLFPRKPPPPEGSAAREEYALSRYEPVLQALLEAHASPNNPAGGLDATVFPYTKPPLDLELSTLQQQTASATSLRAAQKPTWAKSTAAGSALNVSENKQRVIVFMAGGATYSESRVCYTAGRATGREVFLVTSHMLSPGLFVRQVGDLSQERRRLGLPSEGPKPQAPGHLFEPDEELRAAAAPAAAMAGLSVNGSGSGRVQNGLPARPVVQQQQVVQANSSAKLTKDPERERENEKEKEKKKHRFGFGKKER